MSTLWIPSASTQPDVQRRKKKRLGSWLLVIFAVLTLIVWLFPLWMSVTSAFKTPEEIATTSWTSLPTHWTLENFTRFAHDSDFGRKLRNSIIISGGACIISLIFSFLNAVALGVGRVKRSRAVMTICLIVFAIPQEAIVYPTYKVAKILNVYGNPIAVIVILGIIYSAFGTLLLGEVMRAFPRELIDAAFVDGVSMRHMMRHVVYPIVKPSLKTLGIMIFIWDWNEYMMPLILLPNNDTQTVPIAIASTFSQPGFGVVPDIAWGAAGALLSSAPTVLLFLLFQRVIARGITVGTD